MLGVAQGINFPNVFSLLNSHAPNENRGAFMATNGMALRTGQTVGPLLMAFLAGTLGATGAYLATAVIALTAFLLAFVAVRERRGPESEATRWCVFAGCIESYPQHVVDNGGQTGDK